MFVFVLICGRQLLTVSSIACFFIRHHGRGTSAGVFRSEFRRFLSCLDWRQSLPNGNNGIKTRPSLVWNGTGAGGGAIFANQNNFNHVNHNNHGHNFNFNSVVSINKQPNGNVKRSSIAA